MIASAISRTVSLQTVTLNCQVKVVRQALRRGEKFLERRPLDHFVFAAFRIAAAAVQILIEERGDVELFERIGGSRSPESSLFRLSGRFLRCNLRG